MKEETLTTAFTKLRTRFIRLAKRYLTDSDEADDVLQEAFCRLWPKRAQLQSAQEAEAMATATVRNLCIDSWRRQQSISMVELDVERDSPLSEAADAALERSERFRQVQAIIERELSPLQQTILQRKELDGEDIASIARDLQMQQAAVRMHLSRARKAIRECYRKWEEKR